MIRNTVYRVRDATEYEDRYASSNLAFAMNTTDHINVVFCKSSYSLMSRVTASPNSIVAAIVNSDAYRPSALMDKWENMLYV